MPHTNQPHPEERPEGAHLEGPTAVLQASSRCVNTAALSRGRLKTYIRVVTLPDGETVHNVFKDSDFAE